MQESGGVFAEGEDSQGNKFQLRVCGGGGVLAEAPGETEEFGPGAARVVGGGGDLQEDLVDEGGG